MEVVRTDQRVLSLRAFVQNKQTPDRQTRNKTHQSWEFAISSVCQTEGASNFQNMQIWTLDSSDTEFQQSTNHKRRLQVFATLQVPLQWRRFTSTVNWEKCSTEPQLALVKLLNLHSVLYQRHMSNRPTPLYIVSFFKFGGSGSKWQGVVQRQKT